MCLKGLSFSFLIIQSAKDCVGVPFDPLHLIFRPHKKTGALTEGEVTGTVSVRSRAYWPYPSSVLTRHNSRTRDWNRGLGFGVFRDWVPFSLTRTCPHCATAIPRSVSLTFPEGAEFWACGFSRRVIVALEYSCKRSIFFEGFFFWRICLFWRKENSFCELWEKFEKRSEKRMAEVEARPDDGQRTEQGGVEEGEIVSVETQADRPAEAPKKHPLEHAWTFWFDNPNGKQKQVAWGSSIRAVYTFSTVEDFWWYVFSPLLSLFLFFVSCSYLDFCLPVFVAIFLLLSLHCVHRKRLLLSFFTSCSLRTRRQLFLFPFDPHACKDVWYEMLRHWDIETVERCTSCFYVSVLVAIDYWHLWQRFLAGNLQPLQQCAAAKQAGHRYRLSLLQGWNWTQVGGP